MKYKCQMCNKTSDYNDGFSYTYYCKECNCSFNKDTCNLVSLWKNITKDNKTISYSIYFSEGKTFIYSGVKSDEFIVTPLEFVLSLPFILKITPSNFEEKLKTILLFL